MPTVDEEIRAALNDPESLHAALDLVLEAIPLDPPAMNLAKMVVASAVDRLVAALPVLAALDAYDAAEASQGPYLAGQANANDPAFLEAVRAQGAAWRAFLRAWTERRAASGAPTTNREAIDALNRMAGR